LHELVNEMENASLERMNNFEFDILSRMKTQEWSEFEFTKDFRRNGHATAKKQKQQY
jgi:hypothetical protein